MRNATKPAVGTSSRSSPICFGPSTLAESRHARQVSTWPIETGDQADR